MGKYTGETELLGWQCKIVPFPPTIHVLAGNVTSTELNPATTRSARLSMQRRPSVLCHRFNAHPSVADASELIRATDTGLGKRSVGTVKSQHKTVILQLTIRCRTISMSLDNLSRVGKDVQPFLSQCRIILVIRQSKRQLLTILIPLRAPAICRMRHCYPTTPFEAHD
jgi:hypothetical protein